MHILLAVMGVLGGLAIWYWRLKAAQEAGGEILNAANDVKLAARRFAYRRKHNVHPADSVEDPRLAAAGVALAVASMDGPLSKAELDEMNIQAQKVFEASGEEAQEITAFGRWIIGQCGTADEAVTRLVKVIRREAGAEAAEDLLAMTLAVAGADGDPLDDLQTQAMDRARYALTRG